MDEASTEEDFLKTAPKELISVYKELSRILEKFVEYSGGKVRYDVVLIDDRKGLRNEEGTYLTLVAGDAPDKFYVLPYGSVQELEKGSGKKLITLYVGLTALEKGQKRLKQVIDRSFPGENYQPNRSDVPASVIAGSLYGSGKGGRRS